MRRARASRRALWARPQCVALPALLSAYNPVADVTLERRYEKVQARASVGPDAQREVDGYLDDLVKTMEGDKGKREKFVHLTAKKAKKRRWKEYIAVMTAVRAAGPRPPDAACAAAIAAAACAHRELASVQRLLTLSLPARPRRGCNRTSPRRNTSFGVGTNAST